VCHKDFVLFIVKPDLHVCLECVGEEMLWSDYVEWRAKIHEQDLDGCARGAQVFHRHR